MKFQKIIFDWDGTLARTLELWLAGYQKSLTQRNLKFDSAEIITEFFHNHHEVPDRHPTIDFPTIAEEVRKHVYRSLQSVELYEGALETLVALRASKTDFSLVSSSSRQILEVGLGAHSLNSYFDSTIAGDDGYGHKPSTLPFEEMLMRMGCAPEETLIIGDSHVDITAGKAVGCHTCLFAPPLNAQFHDFEHLKSMNADFEISAIPELLEYI
ncbi:HAD family hydrolase [Leucothrix arctica]|uniref:phosphoglycolate phosphatase n=1 Tax=Leucothrix arctica TaxID=1481894 RepID=A0A317CIK9_9GAMM|nr:HAD-IA family hydrolase [Leucothrix arctica]PWQ98398.1 phosphoglycolate phosphatase [Leucothrix arctica]